MSEIRTVCVYCASSDQCRPIFLDSAFALGTLLAKENIDIVYGGGSTGLMGRLADGAIAGNGHVRGIIPQFMQNLEWGHKGISVLEEVEDMHTRKFLMIRKSDGIVALPGGCGTLEELLEAITWKRLGLAHQPIVIVNIDGFYDPLITMLQRTVDEQFMRPEHLQMWHIVHSVEEVLPMLRSIEPWPLNAISYAKV
ncbi:MAG: TIGR00730 family Rossman fold protein [Ignavibacteria bacterium]